MSWADGFLVERDPAAWSAPDGFPAALTPSVAFFQRHGDRVVPHGLEIVLASSSRRPSAQQMRDGWGRRRAGRASPVLLCVGYPLDEPTTWLQSGGTAVRLAVCGPVGDSPPVVWDLDVEQVERMSDCTLDEPDQHAAIRLLRIAGAGTCRRAWC